MHTLCLLDIKVKERSIENMMKGRAIFEPPRFMTTAQAAEQLVEIGFNRKKEKLVNGDSSKKSLVDEDTMAVAVARVGSDEQKLVTCSLGELKHLDMGKPLHSLVIPGHMHPMEMDAIKMHALPF